MTLTAASAAVLLLGAATASAANYTVDNLGDDTDASLGDPTCDTTPAGPPVVCTLRAALDEANSTPITDDVITISVPGQISLPNGVLLISGSTEIDGNAAGNTIDAGNAGRVFSTGGTSVTLKDLTVTHGTSGSDGAGIFSNSTLMTLMRVTVTANTATSANGAGIASGGGAGLELYDSTVSNNTITGAGGLGGGIKAGGTLVVVRSTISGNSTVLDINGRGGGIDMSPTGAASLTVTNSTISGNHSGGNNMGAGGGGGIFASSNVNPVTVTDATIAGNTTLGGGGGAVFFSSTAVQTKNSIYAQNTDVSGSPNCVFLTTPDAQNNIDSGSQCGFGIVNGNQENVTPAQLLLGTLANNGGPTQTRALGAGSVAINAATNCASQTQDQRSFTRPQPTGGPCDIGALEVQDSDGDGVVDTSDSCPTQAGPSSNGGCPLPPPSNPPASAPAAAGPGVTGLRAAALKKCKRRHGAARTKCKKKANLLPV